MTTFQWTISNCKYDAETGGIKEAHWRVSSDGKASAYGSVAFTPNASDPAFKPYAEVTEDDVLGWVWQTVDRSATEQQLLSRITTQSTSLLGMPWVNQDEDDPIQPQGA